MRYGVYNGREIINAIEWDGNTSYELDEGLSLVDLTGTDLGIGWIYENGAWTPPPWAIPEPMPETDPVPPEEPDTPVE